MHLNKLTLNYSVQTSCTLKQFGVQKSFRSFVVKEKCEVVVNQIRVALIALDCCPTLSSIRGN